MQKIGTKITVTVSDEMLEEIEKIAEKHMHSKAHITRMLLETGLDTYKMYSVFGVTKLAEVVRKVKLKLQEKTKEE